MFASSQKKALKVKGKEKSQRRWVRRSSDGAGGSLTFNFQSVTSRGRKDFPDSPPRIVFGPSEQIFRAVVRLLLSFVALLCDNKAVLHNNSAEGGSGIAAVAHTESEIMLGRVIGEQVKHSRSSLKCLLFKMNSERQTLRCCGPPLRIDLDANCLNSRLNQ